MSLARFLFCLVTGCGIGLLGTVPARSQGVGEALHKAEAEIAHAAESDPSHGNPNTDPLSVDPDLAVWTFVVFVVLLIVLKKFAWGPIVTGLERREKAIADHIAETERNHEEAKRLLAQYDQKLASAANEVRQLMEEARQHAEHAKQEILAEAKAGAEAERARALHDIESATDQAMESLAHRSAQLAVELAGKILHSKLDAGDHARLIEEAMAKFPVTSSNN